MNPAPLSIKRRLILGLFFIGGVLALALVGAGYLYTQVTVYAEPASVGSASMVDADEAARKLRQLEDSFKSNRRGFVRLDESEINSLLNQRYFKDLKNAVTSSSTSASVLLQNARVRLKNEDVKWITWVGCDFMGRKFNLVWQRSVQLKREGDHWGFEVVAMRVGRQTIPRSYWETVQKWMGSSDERLTDQYEWLTHLPTIEIKVNESSQATELLLYNYVVTNVATNQNQ